MMPIKDLSPDFPCQLFSTFGPIPGSFQGQIMCVILTDTYAMEISPANFCLLNDQAKTIIKQFFEICTKIDP